MGFGGRWIIWLRMLGGVVREGEESGRVRGEGCIVVVLRYFEIRWGFVDLEVSHLMYNLKHFQIWAQKSPGKVQFFLRGLFEDVQVHLR